LKNKSITKPKYKEKIIDIEENIIINVRDDEEDVSDKIIL
jgi:hypothetical protein